MSCLPASSGEYAVFGKVQGKQLVGLFVHQRVAGVDILGLAVIQHAATKGDHIAPHVNNGGHNPVAKVVIIPFLPFSDQPGVHQFCRLVALGAHMLDKAKRYMEDKAKAQNDDELDEPEYDAKCEALIPLLERKIPAHFHAHRADDIFTAIRIAKEFNLDLVLVHATEGYMILDELKEENIPVLAGPYMTDRSKPELKNLSRAATGIMSNNGIKTAIITDHPETPIQFLPLTAAVAVREGMDEYDAIRAITSTAAKICKIYDRVGSIEIGKDGDIVLFNDSPLDVMKKPKAVIAGGKFINS